MSKGGREGGRDNGEVGDILLMGLDIFICGTWIIAMVCEWHVLVHEIYRMYTVLALYRFFPYLSSTVYG